MDATMNLGELNLPARRKRGTGRILIAVDDGSEVMQTYITRTACFIAALRLIRAIFT